MQFPNIEDAPVIKRGLYTVDKFKGIDLSTSPAQVSEMRSPDAPNMIGDLMGKPTKRTGFQLVHNYGARINGRWELLGHEIIHAGTRLYIDQKLAWSDMKDEKSTAQVVGEKLYIFDGEEPIICDGEDAYPLTDEAFIPTVYISKDPSGGGEPYQDINLLSDYFIDSFYVSEENASATEFQLSFDGLTAAKVKVQVLDSNGNWIDKVEGTDFTVDRKNGTITFGEAPGQSPVSGEDSVRIKAAKWFEDYYEKIAHCNQSVAYSSGGTQNRIFVSGNPDYPNYDFWCQTENPAYFPDLCYMVLGEGKCRIVGYSILEGQLATHIAPALDGRSIVLRSYHLDEDDRATFPINTVMQGEEAIAPRSFVYMETEPMFITERGVYALTAADIDGRIYTQNRSYYINVPLRSDLGLANAECTKFKHYYVISLGDKLYLLDTAQKSYQRGEPLSSYQYECYLWTGIPARILWENDGALWFGDNEGNVCMFSKTTASALSYQDYNKNGNKPIEAYWTFPDFDGQTFWRNKTIRVVGLRLAPYAQNVIRLDYRVKGFWSLLKDFSDKNSYFSWDAFTWDNFTWSGDTTYRTVTAKVKIKKFDKCGFRISCEEKYKAFGLYGFSVEYTENGRYKK